MKKILSLVIIITSIIGLLNGCVTNESGQDIFNNEELILEDIQNEIIRFHVLANSDTEEDQALKLKVRDKVVEEMYGKLSGCKNIDEARIVMLDNMDEVNSIAEKVIKENGYNYTVTSELSRENFPDKMYGDTLFPQGNYEAFRILIGEAKGQNWWCVMFPPLCFVDESKQAINTSKTKENLEGKTEIKKENNEVKTKEKIKFKSKLFEMIKGK